MRSLSAHLRQIGDHGGLPFHPDCAICQERLIGSLRTDVISHRSRAALAAGVLALSSAAPATAIAAEADLETAGTAEPGQVQTDDLADSTQYDPGGASTSLPSSVPAVPETPVASESQTEDDGPLEQEPTTDEDPTGAAEATTDTESRDELSQTQDQEPATASRQAQSNAEAPQPPSAATSPPEASHPASDPAVPAVVTGQPTVEPASEERQHAARVTPRRKASDHPAHTDHVPAQAPPRPQQQAPQSDTIATISAADRARPGDRAHVVVRGESLWSIASDTIGDQPSAARIASEVHRLWELNKRRIATGNPNLILVGTELRLR